MLKYMVRTIFQKKLTVNMTERNQKFLDIETNIFVNGRIDGSVKPFI